MPRYLIYASAVTIVVLIVVGTSTSLAMSSLLLLSFVLFIFFINHTSHPGLSLPGIINFLLFLIYSLLTSAFYTANFFTGEGINFDVINHLNFDSFEAGFYAFEIYHGITLIIIVLFFIIYLSWLKQDNNKQKYRSKLFYFFIILIMFSLHPFSISSARLFMSLTDDHSSSLVLERIEKNLYPDELFYEYKKIDKKLPNILLIYLESMERTYFDNRYYAGLMDEIEQLSANGLDFTDVRMTWGATHTIAGMIASLCGIPINSPSGGMEMSGGADVYMPKAQCLGDITKKLGYFNLFYQGASLNFTNKGGFMRSHGFDEVKGLNELKNPEIDPEDIGPWGIHDDILLQRVENRLEELLIKNNTQPFLFTVLTLDTHDVFGERRVSRWCEQHNYEKFPAADHEIQHAVYCSDKLLSRFIKKVYNRWGEQLLVVVLNDHVAYRFNVGKMLQEAQNAGERRLLFTIFDKKRSPDRIKRSLSILDLGATLLGYITENKFNTIGLGSNALHTDQENLIEELGELSLNKMLQSSNLALGKKIWQMPSFKDHDITIDVEKKNLVISDYEYPLPVALLLDRQGRIVDFYGERISDNIGLLKVSPRIMWVDKCINIRQLLDTDGKDDDICLAVGNLAASNLYSSSINGRKIIKYKEFISYFKAKNDYKIFHNRLYLGEKGENKFSKIEYFGTDAVGDYAIIDVLSTMNMIANLIRYKRFPTMMERLDKDINASSRRYGYPKDNGFYLFELNEGNLRNIYHWETCSSGKTFLHFNEILEKHKSSQSFVLVSAREVTCNDDLTKYFNNSPFKLAASLKSHQPFVAFWERNQTNAVSVTAPPNSNIKLRLINKELLKKKFDN